MKKNLSVVSYAEMRKKAGGEIDYSKGDHGGAILC